MAHGRAQAGKNGKDSVSCPEANSKKSSFVSTDVSGLRQGLLRDNWICHVQVINDLDCSNFVELVEVKA